MGGAVDAARQAVDESAQALRQAFDNTRGINRNLAKTAQNRSGT